MEQKRKVVKINKTYYISLPTKWVVGNKIDKTSILNLEIDLDSIIIKPYV